MRTTLDVESDVLNLAKSLAEARRISVGKALSWLARKGAQSSTLLGERNGFCVFPVADSQPTFGPSRPTFGSAHPTFGPDDVRAALDAEDLIAGRDFLNPRPPA